VLRINEDFDVASDARLSPNETCPFEREHHLVN